MSYKWFVCGLVFVAFCAMQVSRASYGWAAYNALLTIGVWIQAIVTRAEAEIATLRSELAERIKAHEDLSASWVEMDRIAREAIAERDAAMRNFADIEQRTISRCMGCGDGG